MLKSFPAKIVGALKMTIVSMTISYIKENKYRSPLKALIIAIKSMLCCGREILFLINKYTKNPLIKLCTTFVSSTK